MARVPSVPGAGAGQVGDGEGGSGSCGHSRGAAGSALSPAGPSPSPSAAVLRAKGTCSTFPGSPQGSQKAELLAPRGRRRVRVALLQDPRRWTSRPGGTGHGATTPTGGGEHVAEWGPPQSPLREHGRPPFTPPRPGAHHSPFASFLRNKKSVSTPVPPTHTPAPRAAPGRPVPRLPCRFQAWLRTEDGLPHLPAYQAFQGLAAEHGGRGGGSPDPGGRSCCYRRGSGSGPRGWKWGAP